jgi:hypothetical protein
VREGRERRELNEERENLKCVDPLWQRVYGRWCDK